MCTGHLEGSSFGKIELEESTRQNFLRLQEEPNRRSKKVEKIVMRNTVKVGLADIVVVTCLLPVFPNNISYKYKLVKNSSNPSVTFLNWVSQIC